MTPLSFIDKQLNTITMYRLMAYGLAALLGIATVFCFMGVLNYSGLGLLGTTALSVAASLGADYGLRKLYHTAVNYESALITGLILACIMPQVGSVQQALGVVITAVLAIASKYFVAWQGKHAFNPAGFGAAAASITGIAYASWWIGTPVLLPFVAVFGGLILRKLHRFELAGSFLLAALAVSVLVALTRSREVSDFIQAAVLQGPLIFFAVVMLTEPATMPTRRYYQTLFAILVGALFACQLHIFDRVITPQFALLAGNLFAFLVCFRRTITLALKQKTKLSPNLYEFAFTANHRFDYQAGQYMAWTLPHHRPDQRGNRRTFTLASSPTEDTVRVAARVEQHADRGSSYKRGLVGLKIGDVVAGSQLAGDFTLPANPHQRLVWIAGGIGITPFRSMAQYLSDTGQQRTIDLFYLARNSEDFVYKDVFDAAIASGLTSHYLTAARLPIETIRQTVGDELTSVHFYISGPNAMVQAYRKLLRQAGVPSRHIISDYFSGY